MSTRQAAAFLGVGRNKLLRLLQTKRIKAKDLDGRLRFTTESLREFLDALPDALEAERQRRRPPAHQPSIARLVAKVPVAVVAIERLSDPRSTRQNLA
jgi:excisionase family DNA binding protein